MMQNEVQCSSIIGHATDAPMRLHRIPSLLALSCQKKLGLTRLYHPSPRISVIVHLAAMSVIMEQQQGTSTSTVANIQIPGVPSDASVLNSLRNPFRRNDFRKGPTPTFEARTTEVRGTVDVPTHTAIVREPD